MGKGAGKLDSWFIQLTGGTTILEFKNLRLGRANYFLKQVACKMPVNTTTIRKETKIIKLETVKSTNVTLKTFW